MIGSIDRKSLYNFVQISLLTIVFGELDKNKNYIYYNNNNTNNNNTPLYQQVSDTSPYLPPINPKYKYTLVLDMDETLIHFFFSHISGMFFVRPYTFEFLKSLQPFYEIITFTAGTKEYADNILNIIDNKNNIINYRLYRNHTTIINLNVYKDLSKIGRDLKKTIIIDNLKDNYKLQYNNGIYIKTWTSDINDNWLKEIKRILITIVKKQVNDVRKVIEKINEEVEKRKNVNNNYMGINVEKICDLVNN
jgi:CTD small phosphatase-like protein 2